MLYILYTGFQILLKSLSEVKVDMKIKAKQDKKNHAAIMEQIMILTQTKCDEDPGTVTLEASLPATTEEEILLLEEEVADKQKRIILVCIANI